MARLAPSEPANIYDIKTRQQFSADDEFIQSRPEQHDSANFALQIALLKQGI
jgi:hypothetical protein